MGFLKTLYGHGIGAGNSTSQPSVTRTYTAHSSRKVTSNVLVGLTKDGSVADYYVGACEYPMILTAGTVTTSCANTVDYGAFSSYVLGSTCYSNFWYIQTDGITLGSRSVTSIACELSSSSVANSKVSSNTVAVMYRNASGYPTIQAYTVTNPSNPTVTIAGTSTVIYSGVATGNMQLIYLQDNKLLAMWYVAGTLQVKVISWNGSSWDVSASNSSLSVTLSAGFYACLSNTVSGDVIVAYHDNSNYFNMRVITTSGNVSTFSASSVAITVSSTLNDMKLIYMSDGVVTWSYKDVGLVVVGQVSISGSSVSVIGSSTQISKSTYGLDVAKYDSSSIVLLMKGIAGSMEYHNLKFNGGAYVYDNTTSYSKVTVPTICSLDDMFSFSQINSPTNASTGRFIVTTRDYSYYGALTGVVTGFVYFSIEPKRETTTLPIGLSQLGANAGQPVSVGILGNVATSSYGFTRWFDGISSSPSGSGYKSYGLSGQQKYPRDVAFVGSNASYQVFITKTFI